MRRDWSGLSKRVSTFVLNQVMSGKPKDEIQMALNDFLSDIGHRLKNNLINISEYIITKQLTKLPKDYNKFDALPHVAVADRLIRTGKKAET